MATHSAYHLAGAKAVQQLFHIAIQVLAAAFHLLLCISAGLVEEAAAAPRAEPDRPSPCLLCSVSLVRISEAYAR